MASEHSAVLTREGLVALIPALGSTGYRVCGPVERDQAIVYDDISGQGDLPEGCTVGHDRGHFRLTKTGDSALFNHFVGPQKKYLHPPRQTLWRAGRDRAGRVAHDDVDGSPDCPSVRLSPAFSGSAALALQRAPFGLRMSA